MTFLQQELQFCNEADTITRSSLKAAIQSFDDAGRVSAHKILPIGKRIVATYDALRCLKTVENPLAYRSVETAFPTSPKYRIHDNSSHLSFPRDAVHLACAAHWTRLQNVLRSPGINMTEKAVLRQRAANMKTIQKSYVEKQKQVLKPL